MKLRIAIEMNNAAFEEGRGAEAARILRDLADRLEDDGVQAGTHIPLYDINGNRVGNARTE